MLDNNLVVIENGQINNYLLDDKQSWNIGRLSKGNVPDICLFSTTISRHHGTIRNDAGIWKYSGESKNGTIFNGKFLKPRPDGRPKTVSIESGDKFIFGAGDEATINHKTAWALFVRKNLNDVWQVENTEKMTELSFECEGEVVTLNSPEKGTVIDQRNGIAIYMGNLTYLMGEMKVTGK